MTTQDIRKIKHYHLGEIKFHITQLLTLLEKDYDKNRDKIIRLKATRAILSGKSQYYSLEIRNFLNLEGEK